VTGIAYVMDSDQEEAAQILQERPVAKIALIEPQMIAVTPPFEKASKGISETFSN
jgi:hypothetical protein